MVIIDLKNHVSLFRPVLFGRWDCGSDGWQNEGDVGVALVRFSLSSGSEFSEF